ncbi:metal-dependent hydrolase [Paracoccus sp. (in: a-proteobacteria)]|uniref:metal-dependent hydrolase n=1 Tax=Paracoccus sp. TaxID=267 RepID=UPI003A8BFAD3
MLTAHLPSGYCLGKLSGLHGLAFSAAIAGAVLPDADILFFYFVDHKAIHHHRYWVHVPFFWAVVASVALPLLWRSRHRPAALAFFAAIFMHLILDSIGGGIMWLAPFNNELSGFVTVPPRYSNWVLSFLLHWTIVFEFLIWAGAACIFAKGRRRGQMTF